MGSAKPKSNNLLAELVAPDGKALYASRSGESRGRVHKESPSKTRGNFERDRDRIIYSAAFRRLKFKTQVFVFHEGDHYRTRLSHSMEVAQVARYLARQLKIDEDLAETCALAHDLGHSPFAHAGEDALKECMEPYGGFDHNDQTLRMVTLLEKKYPDFDGLNLSWESLEGLLKHNGPVEDDEVGITLKALTETTDLMLNTYASVEAQAAGLADDIAYNSHDLEDGLEAKIFTLDDLTRVDWVAEIIKQKRKEYSDSPEKIIAQEVIREVMGVYAADVLAESTKRLAELAPKSADDVRHAKDSVVAMSKQMQEKDSVLREFLWTNFYRHQDINRMSFKAFQTIHDLFKVFMEHRRCLPQEWADRSKEVPKGWDKDLWHARNVADYIACMTDRKALAEHKALFDKYQVIK